MLKPFLHENIREAGCDEAGRGCLAGPVVAAAVILPSDYHHPLLNDSKQLKASVREKLRAEIESEAIAWAVGWVSNQEIDQINILKASFLAMHRAIEQLPQVPEHLLIDGNRFTPYPGIAHTCIVKGDSLYYSIAAASVLAKTYRDAFMSEQSQQYPHYQWQQNAGYPTLAHRQAIQAHGLSPLHRLSFRQLPDQLELF
ncbi:ribonuclease HII [Cytophagales bacterium LB-30]|uniref:Ribonuclease HII n=1 Tax=Shiella aurantiaca TaxID=3058365 RepID=A0ABT8F8U4_9BACT|nr:ribonuclease HII [Shiella aurantiaca]MDN4166902.1 ribonuclease HII [Shiella aurantiaca]